MGIGNESLGRAADVTTIRYANGTTVWISTASSIGVSDARTSRYAGAANYAV